MTESTSERILVTGGFGCIGTQVVKWLLSNTDATVVVGAREVTDARISGLFGDSTLSRLACVSLEVRDQQQLERVLQAHDVTRVVHLAVLQTPACNADRDLGLQINLAGTQNLIEAVKRCRPTLRRFVFASSVAVYGPRRSYPGPKVPMLAEPAPVNVYGAWKLTGEQVTRFLFHLFIDQYPHSAFSVSGDRHSLTLHSPWRTLWAGTRCRADGGPDDSHEACGFAKSL